MKPDGHDRFQTSNLPLFLFVYDLLHFFFSLFFFPPLLFCFVCLEREEWNRGLNGVKSGFMRGRKKREKEFTSYSLNISTFCTFSDFSKFKFRAKRMNFILRPIEKGRRIFKDFRTKYSCHKVFYTSNRSLFS